MPRSAGDLMLAAVLALLSYAPFEYVAKTTLIVAAGLFILDPIPPYSRLIALISVGLVGLLSKTLKSWQEGREERNFDLDGNHQRTQDYHDDEDDIKEELVQGNQGEIKKEK